VHPLAIVGVASSIAAAMAALGALPLQSGRAVPRRTIGWATALAAGLMIGVAYALMTVALDRGAIQSGVGALAGIAGVAAARARLHAGNAFQLGSVHAIPEGAAIGGAMAVSVPFGLMMAATLAVHNIPEGTVTIASLRPARGLGMSTLLAVVANVNQIVFGIAAFAAVQAAPALLPWLLGFSVGALLHLVFAELLPASYQAAGRTSIALVTIVAVAIVVLLHDGAS
jgi:ZIP family zinc transporter